MAIDMPMEAGTQFVAVAGLFISPDMASDSWRLVLTREELDSDQARHIELKGQTLTLLPLKDD